MNSNVCINVMSILYEKWVVIMVVLLLLMYDDIMILLCILCGNIVYSIDEAVLLL